MVHAARAVAKHKVAGSTPVTRSDVPRGDAGSKDRSPPMTPGGNRSSPFWSQRRRSGEREDVHGAHAEVDGSS